MKTFNLHQRVRVVKTCQTLTHLIGEVGTITSVDCPYGPYVVALDCDGSVWGAAAENIEPLRDDEVHGSWEEIQKSIGWHPKKELNKA